jgi:FG-GAP repeat
VNVAAANRRTVAVRALVTLLLVAALLVITPLSHTAAAVSLPAAMSLAAPCAQSGDDLTALLALQQAEFTDPHANNLEDFGCSVAVSGNTALVGADGKTFGGHSFSGAVYVFVRSGSTWAQQAVLTAADAADVDGFGLSVALSGDTALIGAPFKAVGGRNDAGAAYVFTRSGTHWTQQAKLTVAGAARKGWFGYSVALSGKRALVGAVHAAAGGHKHTGAAYVFTRSGTTWFLQAKLSAADAGHQDEFGVSVALAGKTALVGADWKDVGGKYHSGAAYVFTRSGKRWSQRTRLTAAHPAPHGFFGGSVALAGDTALIGARFATVGGQSCAGAAYVFARSRATWSQQARLTAADAAAYDSFGLSVALSGDTALVGALWKTVGGHSSAGAAYVFARWGTSWSQQAKLTAADAAQNDSFGYSVALAGTTALVGADAKAIGGHRAAGAAYVYALGAASGR